MDKFFYRNKNWLYNQYVILHKPGESIAKEFSLHRELIYKWLKRNNIKMRKNGEHLIGKRPHNYIGIHRNGKYLEMFVSKKKILSHRKIMEDFLHRKLKKNETVHHINGNPTDNRIENLQLFSSPGKHLAIGHHLVYGRKV